MLAGSTPAGSSQLYLCWVSMAANDKLADLRRSLPEAPGVYLFTDGQGRVLYVGKAKSIRKRVNSHFSGRSSRAPLTDLIARIEGIDVVETASEAEALLAEQNFIKRHRPPFNIRLRDDKSYPYIGISLDEEFPRVFFTRERHRPARAYFGPFSSAKRVRETLDLLGKLFPYRTCEGPEPGRASGNPCLDYYIKRCQAPCVGYISKQDYRQNIDAIVDFLSGRYRQIERELGESMARASAEQEFERAAVYRNRLRAVHSLFERQRVAHESVGTLDVIAVAVEGTDANAQVFQVRDGVLAGRQSFYLENRAGRSEAEVAEEFVVQYYASSLSIPPEIVGPPALAGAEGVTEALVERRDGPVELRHARRGDKRRIYELAERNAKLALEQDKLRTERRRQQRVDALNELREVLGLDALPVRIECFDVSNLGPTHTVSSMVVFEGGAPKKSDYRRFKIRALGGRQDDFAAMEEVLARRMAQFLEQRERSPHDAAHDSSFAALPGLVVIDGGRGQLSSGLQSLQGFLDQGVAVVGLAKRLEEVFLPERRNPVVLPGDSVALQLLQRLRDEAHRFAIEHHRLRRDRSMTVSILDELPGIGPARKRSLLRHFGSPERCLRASREALEALPGLPGKVARRLHEQLHRTGPRA
jgi:excinuclease ABC subunit C